jgi:hypothetical protein
MIEAWRQTWTQRSNGLTDPNFPFGFVQVSLFVLKRNTIHQWGSF